MKPRKTFQNSFVYTVTRTLSLGFSIVIIKVMIHTFRCNFGWAEDYRWLPVYRGLCCTEVSYKFHCKVLKFLWKVIQSRAQTSPAPRSAVGHRGELWGYGIFTAEIVRFRFLCACLGLMKTEVTTKSTSAYIRHYMIEEGGISVKRAFFWNWSWLSIKISTKKIERCLAAFW